MNHINHVSFLLKILFLFPYPHPVFISQFKVLSSPHCREHEQTAHTSLNEELLYGSCASQAAHFKCVIIDVVAVILFIWLRSCIARH